MLPDFWPFLLFAAFFAGMVDAVGGGGGLIQVPALLGLFPTTPIATLFVGYQVASVVGTLAAAFHFVRRVRIPWLIVVPATAAAFVGSFSGAFFASSLPRRVMLPLVIVLMIGAALSTFLKQDFGHTATRVPDGPPKTMSSGGSAGGSAGGSLDTGGGMTDASVIDRIRSASYAAFRSGDNRHNLAAATSLSSCCDWAARGPF